MRETCQFLGNLTSVKMIHLMDCIKVGRLEEATNFLDVCNTGDLTRVLNGYGFDILGVGSYSVVFQVPGEETVIKMNHYMWDKWALYAKYAKETGNINPMLPKVYELHTNPENDMVIARVEKLTPAGISNCTGMYNVIKAVNGDVRRGRSTKRGLRNNTLNYLRVMFDIDPKGHYSRINLAKIVIWLTGHIMEEYSDIGADFHAANWMLRGNQLVLNDPIA